MGYSQKEKIYFIKTYASIVILELIHILLSFSTLSKNKLYQMDVKSTSLNSLIKKKACVEKIHGFKTTSFSNYVLKLNKVLYGVKQTPRACMSI